MRLFSPPRSDQFGGYGRLRDGMFGEISYNYWTISKGRSQTIGWISPESTDSFTGVTKPAGTNQNWYFNGVTFSPRTNTMNTSALGNNFTGGTTLRIGNMIKHHGWEIKSTIMQPQKDSYHGRGGSMDIGDDINSSSVYVVPQQFIQTFYADPNTNPNVRFDWVTSTGPGTSPNIPSGYLWGWFFLGANACGAVDMGWADDNQGNYGLAPLPITFDHYRLESKISHWDVEANYVFRAHATRVGFFEFTGGVRYMQLDDKLTFSGWGMPWKGEDVRIAASDGYTGDNLPGAGNTGTDGGGTDNNNDNTVANIDITEYYLQNGSLPGEDRNYSYTGNIRGPGTVLADSKWNFEAQNHMVGPQVGIRYIKKCSGRWSLIADTKFFAAFNTQNLKSNGIMGARPAITDLTDGLGRIMLDVPGGVDDFFTGTGNIPWVPVGTVQSPGTFRHTETRTAFSPGIDFGLKANWRLSDAIAFNVGYQGMYLDRTARAALVNSYEIDNYGNIFGINQGSVNQATWMHGVNFEVSINRF